MPLRQKAFSVIAGCALLVVLTQVSVGRYGPVAVRADTAAGSQMIASLYAFKKARNMAVSVALLAKDQYGANDMSKAKVNYLFLQTSANTWLEQIAEDVRDGSPIDTTLDQTLQTDATSYLQTAEAFVQFNQDKILAIQNRPVRVVGTPKPRPTGVNVGLFGPSGIPVPGLGDIIKGAQDIFSFFHKHRAEVLAQRAAERNALADQILACGVWPNWGEVNGNYKPPCLAPSSVTPTSTSPPGK